MRSTGVVRRIDELGRIVLPKALRDTMNLQIKDPVEIFTDDGGRIILQKYHPACEFCSNADNIVYFNDKRICRDCIEKIKEQFGNA
jgi:transcriptional pleiotropic regulator of transition state genes